MSARFELVRTDAGTHARYVARNGRIVWSTEPYTDRRGAINAVRLLAEGFSADGRVWIGVGPGYGHLVRNAPNDSAVVIPLDEEHLGLKLAIPIRNVDERAKP